MRLDLICILSNVAFSLANERREAARSGAERREWSGASGAERSGAERSDASGASERVILFFPSASLSLNETVTDRQTDRPTDRRTQPLTEMLGRI